jgi:PII-like signaling protein
MKLEGEQTLLRVHLRNTDKYGWSAATDSLVERAKTRQLAGATVLRGTFGLDVDGKLLESSRWSMIEHVPVIVEFVDIPAKIGAFLADVAEEQLIETWAIPQTDRRGRKNRQVASASTSGCVN